MPTIARNRPMAITSFTAAARILAACSGPTTAAPTTVQSAAATPSASAGTVGFGAEPTSPPPQRKVIDKPFPGQVDIGPAQPRSEKWDRNIYAVYDVRDGLRLGDGHFDATGKWSLASGGQGNKDVSGKLPDTIANRYAFVSVWGYSPGFAYSHRIYDKAGKPTDYWMGSKFASPETGSNSGSCDIYLGDPLKKGKYAPLSPYWCSWENIRGWNPEPTVVLHEAKQIKDADDARSLLEANCNEADSESRCQFIEVSAKEVRGPYEPKGAEVLNPGKGHGKVEKKFGWSEEFGTTTSIGVEVSNQFKLGEIWKMDITVSFEHSWEYKKSVDEEITADVEHETASWLVRSQKFLAASGTWVVDTKDGTRYLLPDVSLKAPLTEGGSYIVQSCDMKDYLGPFTCRVLPLQVVTRSF